MTETRLDRHLKANRNRILLAIALVAFAAFAFYFFLNIYRYPSDMDARPIAFVFLAASLAACGGLVLCYRVISRGKLSQEKLFVIFMITFGVIYAALFLPFTIPDEGEHYLSAYRISNYITFNTQQFGDERLLMRTCDLELFGKLRADRLSPEYYSLLGGNFHMFAGDRSASFIPAKFIRSAPLGYIASALGISLGRFFRLGALPTFYLGRLANLALYTVAVWWAIKRMPYGKTALFVISALPMTIHLVASYSYDYFVIALAMLFVSQVLYMREKPGSVAVKDVVLCVIWGVLLAPAKLVYFPILLTVFLVPNEKFPFSKKKAAFIKTGIVLAGIAALLAVQLGSISNYMSGGNGVSWSEDEVYSVSRMLSHPTEFFRVIFNTAYHFADYHTSMLIGNHMQGTGEGLLPIFLWAPMLFVALFSFLRRRDEDEVRTLRPTARVGVSLIAAAVCGMAALSMLFSWPPVSTNVIHGIQGRYYTPVLPLVALAMRGKLARPQNSDKYILFFFIYCNLLMPMVYFGQLFLPEFI